MTENYRECTRCVMDTTDPKISFDAEGVCNHCHEFNEVTKKRWFPNEKGAAKLKLFIEQIKCDGAKASYDCIIGLSGGVDSSYLAIKARDWGLRPLVVHVDTGWNSELAVANIEKVVKYCGYHLHTHVMDWNEMRELQLAYLRSGISNQDVPQDHAFFSSLYHLASQHGIKYILSGGNLATESIFPRTWHWDAIDSTNLRAIHRKFGKGRLKTYNTLSFLQYYFLYPFIKGIRVVRPLNFMPYHKEQAVSELETTIGWRSYARKHGESIFTRFFQNYYLPTKFGYDKRRPHFSSLIASKQITREEVVTKLQEPLYDSDELENDIIYLCKKLCINRDEFDRLMSKPIQTYVEFPNWSRRLKFVKKAQTIVEKFTGKKVNSYS